MWKIPVFTMMLATMFLGGCNWGNTATEETPMEDVRNDINKGVQDVEDAVTPDNNHDTYNRDVNGVNNNGVNNNGVNNNGTVNENGTNNHNNNVVPEVTNPNSNVNANETNGAVREDNVKIRENENTNTR